MGTVRSAFVWVCISFASAVQAQTPATLVVRVQSDNQPVADAVVIAGNQRAETGPDGRVEFSVPAGAVTLTVTKRGLIDVRQDVIVPASGVEVTVDLVALPDIEEEVVVVATTRTGRRVEDQPTRVEVLGREEIEEKMLMTPGDIVMMLNEMGGLRVQATSPSIGAASVRVQGMKGRYTRFLSDGLPLFGQQVGGLGLLQIPPMDLGQVEVIKGVASALYGAGAMGGVVNLLTRRPGDERSVDLLVNQSTLGGTDGVAFLSTPLTSSVATVAARGRPSAESERSRRRRLGRRGGLCARRRASSALLGRRQWPVRLLHHRHHDRGPRGRHAAGRDAGRHGRAVYRGAGHATVRRRWDGADARQGTVCAHRTWRGGLAASRSSVRRDPRARRARHDLWRGRPARRGRPAHMGCRDGLRARCLHADRCAPVRLHL